MKQFEEIKSLLSDSYHIILLGSESCPLVSEVCPLGELCVGDVVGTGTWLLLSGPSLSWVPRVRPELDEEESD